MSRTAASWPPPPSRPPWTACGTSSPAAASACWPSPAPPTSPGRSCRSATLAALAHEYGARIVVDAAQLAPHRRINIAADDVDYLAFSGHKLYAPFGAGVLVGRTDWLDAGTPHLAGGGAVRDARLDSVSWTTGPARHEGGSPNVLGAAALARATQVIAALDPEQWYAHEDAIRSFLVEGLQGIEGVTVHQIFADSSSDSSLPTEAISRAPAPSAS